MKRFNNISIYRIVAAICILQFHIFYILFPRAIPYETLLSKGVQGLTALSGFLYSQKLITDKKKFYGGNLVKLLIPAAICLAFMITWDVLYMAISRNWDYMLFVTHRAYGGRIITQADNYYYLAYIFVCYLITPLLQRNDKWSVVTVVGAVLFEVLIGFFFGPAMIIVAYIAGYYIGKKAFKTYTDPEEKYSIPSLLLWTGILALSIGTYIVVQTYKFGGTYWTTNLFNLTNNVIVTIFGVATFFFMMMALKFTNKFKSPSIFRYTDRLAYIIYLMNQAFMCGAMNVTLYVDSWWAKMLLIYIFTLSASFFLQSVTDICMASLAKRKARKAQVA